MAGDKVVWTPAMRAAQAEKMRAKRAAETPKQKEDRVSKQKATVKENPEIHALRNKKISETRLSMSGELSEIAKKAIVTKSDEAKKNSLACLVLTPAARLALNQETAIKRKPKQKETNAKIREGVTADWAEMSEDDKHARQVKALTIQAKDYTLIDGSVQRFHSGWEPSCANLLKKLGVAYEIQKKFDLTVTSYFADFVFPDKPNIIVEVKGHPKAWERWDTETYPAICAYLPSQWKVYILDYDIAIDSFTDFDTFLSSLRLVFPRQTTASTKGE